MAKRATTQAPAPAKKVARKAASEQGRAEGAAGAKKVARTSASEQGRAEGAAGAKKVARKAARDPALADVAGVLTALKALATTHTLAGMSRFGLPADNAWGVAVGDLRDLAKRTGRDHALAAALWDSGVYEARLLAAFVDEPAQVTVAQMDRWCREFDNWGVCDTVCFALFDRTPHAFERVAEWATCEAEFVKRGAFALLASLALHDKQREDAAFLACLPLIEGAAGDPRNFVKKGVSWALRGIGARNAALHAAAKAVAERLARSSAAAARWVGKDALREFTRKGPKAAR